MQALAKSLVDVFLLPLNQLPAEHQKAIGTISRLRNGIVENYKPANGEATRVKIKQRNGFQSLPITGHLASTGAASAPAWASPELLETLAEQALSVCASVPRVHTGSGDGLAVYDTDRTISQNLTETIFHTTNRQVQAISHAWKSGVTCAVWNELTDQANLSGPYKGIYIGFLSDDGAWVKSPQLLAAPGTAMGRVVADAVSGRFWVVYNTDDPSPVFTVKSYTVNGLLEATNIVRTMVWETEPGYWDIKAMTLGGIKLVQPSHISADALTGVIFTTYTYSSGVITATSTTDNTVKCRSACAWLTNDVNSLDYLAVVNDVTGFHVYGYEVTAVAQTHEYDMGTVGTMPDTLTGWVRADLDLNVSMSFLAPAQTYGPKYDPACRFTLTRYCDRTANTPATVRQTNGVIQVSRAFRHNGEYHALTYYQSGSGLTISPVTLPIEPDPGDNMIGEGIQAVTVTPGDYTMGAPQQIGNGFTDSLGSHLTKSQAITTITHNGGDSAVASTQRWTFLNAAFTNTLGTGGSAYNSLLTISGSSIPANNDTFRVISVVSATIVVTEAVSINGSPMQDDTLAGVTATLTPTVTFLFPAVDNTVIPAQLASQYRTGTITTTGYAGAVNNTTFSIYRFNPNQTNPGPFFTGDYAEFICAVSGVNVNENSPSASTHLITPDDVYTWVFFNDSFNPGSTGAKLRVVGAQRPGNNTVHTISDVPAPAIIETDTSTGMLPEMFQDPLPTVTIELADGQVPYTFTLGDAAFDESYLNQFLSVSGALPQNNGLYRIVQIISPTQIVAVPANGSTGQTSEEFDEDVVEFNVIFINSLQVQDQPAWFITPLESTVAQVGMFERGIAYADWRMEGESAPLGPNPWFTHVSDAYRDTSGNLHCLLPYRCQSVTRAQSVALTKNQVADAATVLFLATTGLKRFTLGTTLGRSVPLQGELILPGPQAGLFSPSGFHEHGINLGPEKPFVVLQGEVDADLHLTVGTTYQVVVVYEVQDANGNRVMTRPSPVLTYTLSGDNNYCRYGGHPPIPFDFNGAQTANHYGITSRKIVGIHLYRRAVINGQVTTNHYKITSDLNVNGLAPVSTANGSGFAFPDEFTWYYTDQNPDANIVNQEVLYTDKKFLPRYSAPAFSRGYALFKNRTWVIGYDGAVWMSGDKTDGDSTWFFPLYRFTIPGDRPVALSSVGEYLVIHCQKSHWYIPTAQYPDNTGRNGTLPAPVQLTRIKNGCSGHAVPFNGGIAYESDTPGQIWVITPGLDNFWLSEPIRTDMVGLSVNDMRVDKNQKLHVLTNSVTSFVYDPVPNMWYPWTLQAEPKLATLLDGLAVYQDVSMVNQYSSSVKCDTRDGTSFACMPTIVLDRLDFGNVRGYKRLWQAQLIGTYKGVHQLDMVLAYPDDQYATSTVFPAYEPSFLDPYIIPFSPAYDETASSYKLTIVASYPTQAGPDPAPPGDSFELELISAQVGIQAKPGLKKLPASIPNA